MSGCARSPKPRRDSERRAGGSSKQSGATGRIYVPCMHGNAGDIARRRGLFGWSDGAGGQQVSRNEPEEFCGKSKSKGGNMSAATYEQVNLMLKLYELRREPKLREARDWFAANFHVKTAEDVMRLCPPG